MVTVRYAVLPASRILNLAGPRYLPEVIDGWRGKRDFHDERYESVRDIMESLYVTTFDGAVGHYRHLCASMAAEGVRNPIVVSAGGLDRRPESHVPPERRTPDLIACEYLGGSRLHVAAVLGMDVPCIVNDHADVLPDAKALPGPSEVKERFTDRPGGLRWSQAGVTVSRLPYNHLPERVRYNHVQQSRFRRTVLDAVDIAVRGWLDAHD